MSQKTYNYTDGVNNIRLPVDETPPQGWYRGQSRRPYTDEEKKKIVEKRRKTSIERYGNATFNNPTLNWKNRRKNGKDVQGRHWYNNSVENRLLLPSEIDETWKPGRINYRFPKMKWYTDGTVNILLRSTDEVPEGFINSRSIDLKFGNSVDTLPNKLFSKKLDDLGISYESEFKIKNRRYDFKVGNNLIEIDPFTFHNSTWAPWGKPKSKNYHKLKSDLAKENTYRCIHIFDWDNENKIIQLISRSEKVYARKCILDLNVSKNEAQNFLETYHLLGYCNSVLNYGLRYDNKLVSIMTFGKPRYNKNYQWELLRFCSSLNIIGGASKLFNAFINEIHPKSIISYCDNSKFDGSTYEKLGFTLKGTSVGKHWYNPNTQLHITDNLLRQRGFDQLLGKTYGYFGKGTSNEELMLQHGFVEIYDAGQSTYVKLLG